MQEDEDTLLHIAARLGNERIVDALILAGADKEARNMVYNLTRHSFISASVFDLLPKVTCLK